MSGAPSGKGIGAFGAVVTIVGFVVGASIYILPGEIAATAGPGVALSYAGAAVLAVFSCVVAAQLGSVFPVSGASFVAIGRLVSPAFAFLCVWGMIGAAVVAVALLGFGFADYVRLWVPGVDRLVLAASLIGGLGGLNLVGVRDTIAAQTLMVAFFLVALLVFAAAALTGGDPQPLSPLLPNGLGPVISGAIPAYFSFAGFMVIIELSGEVRRPARNIPLALAISFVIVAVVYALVALAVVAQIPWVDLARVEAPVTSAAARVLPHAVVQVIAFSAVAATASSINVMLMGYSRDLLALARSRALPRLLAGASPRTGEPVAAILAITVLSLVALAFGARIVDYATFVVVGLMLLQIGVGLAALVLPWRDRERYLASAFRIPGPLLVFFSAGLIVLSIAFIVIAASGSPGATAAGAAFIAIGAVYFAARRIWLKRQAISLEAELARELGFDKT